MCQVVNVYCRTGNGNMNWHFFKSKKNTKKHYLIFYWFKHYSLFHYSVPARISKGQGAGPEKGLFSVLLDFQKRHFFRDTVKSNKVYNEILTFIIYTWANWSVYSTNQPRYNSIFLSLTLKNLATTVSDTSPRFLCRLTALIILL